MDKKLSEILKEMAQTLLKDPKAVPSSEVAHAALLFSHVAWNRSIGEKFPDKACVAILKQLEASNPFFWDEFIRKDRKRMVKELIEYKRRHYPDDTRVVVACGMRGPGRVRVEWRYPDAHLEKGDPMT